MKARRALSAAGLGGTAALVAAAGGASWYYARRLVEPAADTPPEPPLATDRVRVVGVEPGSDPREGDRIHLEGPDAARRGTWGLAWDGGYAQVARVVEAGADRAERVLRAIQGTPEPGTEAVFDGYAYPADPAVLGLEWREVSYRSPVGDLPGWEFPGTASTWAIFVHGRSARRHEAFRMLPTVAALGLPCLVASYRNDPGAPRSPDGRCHLGATEWEDVEGAVVYALSEGADDVVLIGYSMGGACVVNFLRISPHADRVRAAILEAPVLDWGPVLRRAAIERGLPARLLPVLLPTTMAVARVNAGIDWRSMRHLDRASDLVVPELLIHGDADLVVPVELADSLAAARPDLVTYLRVPGAGHVRSWNLDPEAYETAVRTFLEERIAASPSRRARRRGRRRD